VLFNAFVYLTVNDEETMIFDKYVNYLFDLSMADADNGLASSKYGTS